MGRITIKKLTAAKADQKLFSEFDTKLAVYEKTLDSKLTSAESIVYNDIPKVLRSAHVAAFVVFKGSDPVGYMVVKIKKNPAWYGGNSYGYIETIYVEEKDRGEGLATKLFMETKKWLKQKGVKEIKLRVFTNNQKAIRLYKKWGFESVVLEMRVNN